MSLWLNKEFFADCQQSNCEQLRNLRRKFLSFINDNRTVFLKRDNALVCKKSLNRIKSANSMVDGFLSLHIIFHSTPLLKAYVFFKLNYPIIQHLIFGFLVFLSFLSVCLSVCLSVSPPASFSDIKLRPSVSSSFYLSILTFYL